MVQMRVPEQIIQKAITEHDRLKRWMRVWMLNWTHRCARAN